MSHRLRRLRRVAVVAAVGVLAVVVVSPTIAGSGIGAIFNLGKTNTVSSTTTLTGKSTSRLLQITNTSTGSALQITTKTNVAPMKVNSSVVVTNLNADKVDGVDASGFLQSSGQILINSGRADWSAPLAPATFVMRNWNNQSVWQDSAGNSFSVGNFPDLPVALYGRSMTLAGVQLCYDATGGAAIYDIQIATVSAIAGPGDAMLRFRDETERTDAACRLYSLASPLPITSDMDMNMFVGVRFGADTSLAIGRTTWVFNATSTSAVAPAAPAMEVTYGQPVAPGTKANTPGTTVPAK